MNDEAFYQAKIAGLENECRALRETLRDKFAAAALQGLMAYYGDVSHIVTESSRIAITAAAYDRADQMLDARKRV